MADELAWIRPTFERLAGQPNWAGLTDQEKAIKLYDAAKSDHVKYGRKGAFEAFDEDKLVTMIRRLSRRP